MSRDDIKIIIGFSACAIYITVSWAIFSCDDECMEAMGAYIDPCNSLVDLI